MMAQLPPAWKSVLEQTARASDETFILYSCEMESASVEQTADRLADLGYLQITRAAHYRLTSEGRAMLSGCLKEGVADIVPMRHGRCLILAVICLVVAVFVWFSI